MALSEAQSHIAGTEVARMIIEFHNAFRDTYPLDVLTSSLCAVGPLQAMIGLAIMNGHLQTAPAGRAALGEKDSE